MSIHQAALDQIKQLGLNRFRCNLTGAPYATLDDYQILVALRAMSEDNGVMSVEAAIERLVDEWQLKALAFNSRPQPALIGVKTKALASILAANGGQVQVLTYLMTRLFFPHLGSEPMESGKQRDRMMFAIELHDSASVWDINEVSAIVQQLVTIDSYMSMPYWHTLWAFESAWSKVGLAKSPAAIQEAFANPSVMVTNKSRINDIVKFMFELMLHCAERDGVAGKSGNRLAQEIMFISAQALPKIVIPHFQKTLSEADRLRLEKKRQIDSKKELRIAHSAINGKKHLPGAPMFEVNRAAAELKASMAKKKESATKEKKDSKSISKIDPKFAAAFNKLVLKF